MKIACAVCHIGQARALREVAVALVAAGNEVKIMVDPKQSAYNVFLEGDLLFPGSEVVIPSTHDDGVGRISEIVDWADRVLVTMSPTNLVASTERLMAGAAINMHKPVLGYSEVPCGHLAPVWKDVLNQFTTLFVAQQTQDLQFRSNVVKVGMDIPKLDPIRALATKEILGFRGSDPWIWYSGGPYAQAGYILANIARVAADLRKQSPRLQLVFTRHVRDKSDPRSFIAYSQAVAIAQSLSVPTIENSADHRPGETTKFQRDEIIPYAHLLEACSANGVIVTGHGTDGIKAPYLSIPSILCVGDKLNPHIQDEKGRQKLPLPTGCPMQITELADLGPAIYNVLAYRDEYRQCCTELYPPQAQSPAVIIAEYVSKI